MPEAYEEIVNKIPAETRWAICARALTGGLAGFDVLIQNMVGPEKRKEILTQFYTAGAPAIKQLVDALGLPTHDAEAMGNSLTAALAVIYGPEVQTQILEASPKRGVSRTTSCPFAVRMKEMGTTVDCLPVCTANLEAMLKALNPNVNVVVSARDKCLARGDAYCGDFVLELP